VANPLGGNGQKSVWALQDIPKDTRICPYLGTVLDSPGSDCYTICLHHDVYLDASRVMYDVGYLGTQHQGLCMGLKCPPNYGRYVNTINSRDPTQGHLRFNSYFEGDQSGYVDVWLYALCDISAGSELLVNYGDEFHL